MLLNAEMINTLIDICENLQQQKRIAEAKLQSFGVTTTSIKRIKKN